MIYNQMESMFVSLICKHFITFEKYCTKRQYYFEESKYRLTLIKITYVLKEDLSALRYFRQE